MISKQEILDFAHAVGLAPNIVEKDYALGWLLAGISNHKALAGNWIFKGGTCLKKCFFETYRFSEDLDFTLTDPDDLDEQSLTASFVEIADWVHDEAGIEMPRDTIRFEVYKNPRGNLSAEGRIGYRGPLGRGGDAPRIKLDLTADERVVLEPVVRDVHHPYSDRPDGGIHVRCYSLEELFAEKMRALFERERPRDLYDVVHIYRVQKSRLDSTVVLRVLESKCDFKGIEVPTMIALENRPERQELEDEWTNMLAHQLPELPPFKLFWEELPRAFQWLHGVEREVELQPYPVREHIDPAWEMPTPGEPWRLPAPLDIIRFAAANRLCVNLQYKHGSRLIEPYSLRRTRDGRLLLYAIRHSDGELRSYRVDRIEGAEVTKTPFIAKYAIELSPSGPLSTPRRKPRPTAGRPIAGRKYVFRCTVCGRRFTRKKYNTRLRSHKAKDGYPCPGRIGILLDTRY